MKDYKSSEHAVKEGQSLILVAFHHLPFSGTLVVDAAQMQHAMYYDAMELTVIALPYPGGIAAHSVKGDDHVTADAILLAIRERDDVRIIVMSQELTIHIQNMLV